MQNVSISRLLPEEVWIEFRSDQRLYWQIVVVYLSSSMQMSRSGLNF